MTLQLVQTKPLLAGEQIIEVSFTYDNGFGWECDCTFWFVTDGKTMTFDDWDVKAEVSDHTAVCMTEQAEELAWKKWEAMQR